MVPRWDPFRIMAEMLGGDVSGGWARAGEAMYVPAFEVLERKDAYVFKGDLPGFKESDLDIQLTGNRLTVSGKREAEETEDNDRWYVYERTYGSFTRTFTLPEGIDPENVRAELKNGVLSLFVSKKPEAHAKRIQLKGEGGTTATPPIAGGGKAEKAKA